MTAPPTDDRGSPIRVLTPKDITRAAAGPDPARAALAKRLAILAGVEARRTSFLHLTRTDIAAALWLLGNIAVAFTPLRNVPYFLAITFWGGIAVLIALSSMLSRGTLGPRIAATAVSEGICGQCCYSLRGLPAHPADGCLVCSECGAAWNAARVTRPIWLSDDAARPTDASLARERLGADERGRLMVLPDSRLRQIDPVVRAELPRRVIAAVSRCARIHGFRRRLAVALVFLAIAGLCALLAIGTFFRVAFPSPDYTPESSYLYLSGLFLVLMAGFLLCCVKQLQSDAFIGPEHASRALARHGFCGCCAKPIADLPPDPGGLITCPACGAAWKPSSPSDLS